VTAAAACKQADSRAVQQLEQELLQSSSSYLPCLALMITCFTYRCLLQQLPALPGGTSPLQGCSIGSTPVQCSSGGSSSSTASHKQCIYIGQRLQHRCVIRSTVMAVCLQPAPVIDVVPTPSSLTLCFLFLT